MKNVGIHDNKPASQEAINAVKGAHHVRGLQWGLSVT